MADHDDETPGADPGAGTTGDPDPDEATTEPAAPPAGEAGDDVEDVADTAEVPRSDGDETGETAETEEIDETDEAGGAGETDGADGGQAGDEGRPGWVVPFLLGVVAVVAVVLGIVALAGGDDGDDGGSGDEAAAEAEDEEDDDGDGAGTTVGSTVPPVTTAPGTPSAGMLSDLEPVGGETWEPAGDDVTIAGTGYADTVVSGPIGTCDDGAARTVTYDLGGAYTRLEGVVGLVDGTETGQTVEIGFEADGEQVWWKTVAEGEPSRVQLDLTGIRELTVTATGLFPGVDAAEACVRAAYGDLTLR